jgi:hypothetical protein
MNELPGMFETPAESADKVRPRNAILDLKREEAHWPSAASENFPKLDPDFFTSEPSETQQKQGY